MPGRYGPDRNSAFAECLNGTYPSCPDILRATQDAAMEFGWYVEFHRQVEKQSDTDAFAQGLEQVSAAERWGLDAIWLAEIHQQAARSVMSAPMTVAAAIAGRTS